MPRGCLGGELRFKLLLGLCFPRAPRPQPACRSSHHGHPWVLLSRPGTAPTLQAPAAESQRTHQEITLCGVMDLGHGSPPVQHTGEQLPCPQCRLLPRKASWPWQREATHPWAGRHVKRALCAEPGCGYQPPQGRGHPGPATVLPARGSCSPVSLTPLVHSCRETGANPRVCKFGNFFCSAAGCSLLASPKCCLESELGCHLLNAPRSSILPFHVAAGQLSGALQRLLGGVCVGPQPAGLLICPNATRLG